MPKILEHDRKKELVEFLQKHSKDHTMSEIARMLNITPSSVRFHGVEAGIKFKYRRRTTEKLVYTEGKYFNESHRENWLL